MGTKIVTKDLDRRASQYQGDGLLDIGLGLALILVSLEMYADWPMPFIGIWVILWMFGLRAAKRRITVPRLALVAFEPSPEADRRRIYLKIFTAAVIVLVFAIGVLVFFLADSFPDQARDWLQGITTQLRMGIGLLVLALLGLAGWATGARRLLIYAGLGLLGGFAVQRSWMDFSQLFIVMGVLILGVGILLLTRFLQDHPLPVQD